MNQRKLITDILLLFGIFTLNIPKLTGITFHEWFSIPFTLLLLCHLTLNRQFFTGRISRFGQISKKQKILLIWDILLYWTMAVTLFSGFITSRALLPALGIPIQIDSFFGFLHKQISPIFLIMFGIHLDLQIGWFLRITAAQKKKEKKRRSNYLKNIITAFLFLSVGIGLAVFSTIPVSKTKWSNEIRTQVTARRAAHRKQIEDTQSQTKERSEREEGNLSRKSRGENKIGTDTGKPHTPKPKPAEFSWKAAKEIPTFFVLCGIPFLITAGITFSIQRIRIVRELFILDIKKTEITAERIKKNGEK